MSIIWGGDFLKTFSILERIDVGETSWHITILRNIFLLSMARRISKKGKNPLAS